MIDIEEIKRILPQRYPFLLIDRVLELNPNQAIKAVKNVTINEPFFSGHFPKVAIMPGALIIEAFAQTSALLMFFSVDEVEKQQKIDSVCYLASVNNARFKVPVVPGDQLILSVDFVASKKDVWKYKAAAYVDEKLVAAADMVITVRG